MADADALPPLEEQPAAGVKDPPAAAVPRPRSATSGAAGRARSASRKAGALEQVRADIEAGLTLAGTGLMFKSPTAGQCIVDDADPVSQHIMRMAEQYPKFGEALVAASKVAPPLQLGKHVGRWGVAAAVDAGRVDPHSMVAGVFGVDEVRDRLESAGVVDKWEPRADDDTGAEELEPQLQAVR